MEAGSSVGVVVSSVPGSWEHAMTPPQVDTTQSFQLFDFNVSNCTYPIQENYSFSDICLNTTDFPNSTNSTSDNQDAYYFYEVSQLL